MAYLVKRLTVFTLFFFCKASWAYDSDYYVYEGFSQTLDAFKKISLIFADANYITLFTVFIIFGIFIASMIFSGKGILGTMDGNAKVTLSWLILPLFGTMIFKGLVIPTGTIHIYDQRLNAYQAVSGVPVIIILAGGIVNKIERTVVDIIDNSSATPYSKDAGGLSFKMLYDATNNSSSQSNFALVKSIKKYYMDCHPLALANENNSFNLTTLRSKSLNLIGELELLNSPSSYTEYYAGDGKKTEVVSCQQAWNKIKPIINSESTVEKTLSNICKKNHFDTSDATQKIACKEAFNRAIKVGYNNAISCETFLRNSIIASSIANAIQDENPDVGVRTLTNRAMINEGIGVAIASESWLPTVRATITAIVLGILPILALFLVTPLFPKALNLICSLFAWLALWGIVDAYLHQSSIEQMIRAFSHINAHSMGLLAFWEAPESAMKAMAIMGQARSMGIMISTFISASIFGLNAYSLSSITDKWSGKLDHEGKKAAELTQSPNYSAEMLNSLVNSNATYSASQAFGYEGMSAASTFSKTSSISSDLTTTNMVSGDPIAAGIQVGQVQGGAQAGNVWATQSANINQDLNQISFETASTETSMRIADARANEFVAENLGLEGGVSELSSIITSTSRSASYGQAITSQNIAETIKAQHPNMTENEIWSTIGIYQNAGTIADIVSTEGKTDKLINYKSDSQILAMAEQDAYLDTVKSLGYSETQLIESQGEYNASQQAGLTDMFQKINPKMISVARSMNEMKQAHYGKNIHDLAHQSGNPNEYFDRLAIHDTATELGRANSLLNVSDAMGLNPVETAISREGASWSMAIDQNQAQFLAEKGFISEQQYSALEESGGIISFGFGMSEGFSIKTSSAKAGKSTYTDNSNNIHNNTSINDQTSILRGAYTGQGSSAISATTNKKDIQTILSKESGRKDLALNAAQALTSIYDIQDTQMSNMGWQFSLKGVVSAGKSQTKTQSVNAIYGTYSNMIDALYYEADLREYDNELKHQWVSNEFAQLNKQLYSRLGEFVENKGKDNRINFPFSEYLESRGLSEASRYISNHKDIIDPIDEMRFAALYRKQYEEG